MMFRQLKEVIMPKLKLPLSFLEAEKKERRKSPNADVQAEHGLNNSKFPRIAPPGRHEEYHHSAPNFL
jgi:hypothetical protein